MSIQKKLVVIGNTYAKNYLVYTFERGIFLPQICVPCWDPPEIQVRLEGQIVNLKVHNPCFRPEYERLRPLAYHNSDVILACFALDSPDSLEYIREKFWNEVRFYCPDTPIILVGIKSDLRDEIRRGKQNLVSVEDALMVTWKISAADYIECSPKIKFNVEDVFVRVAEVALMEQTVKRKQKKRRTFWCC